MSDQVEAEGSVPVTTSFTDRDIATPTDKLLAAAPPKPRHPGLAAGHVPEGALDPRTDGKKPTLEAGDCVVLAHDPTRLMGCVTGLELSPWRTGEVVVSVAWPDPSDKRGYALTRHEREGVVYVGHRYPAELHLPHPAASGARFDPSRAPGSAPPVSPRRAVSVSVGVESVGLHPHKEKEPSVQRDVRHG